MSEPIQKCKQCLGTGRTNDHVSGEVECSGCEGDGRQTTAVYPNRIADKEKVERELGLPEFDDDQIELYTKRGTLFSRGYVRIVYGDHGPYIEFTPEQVICGLKKKFDNPLPPKAFYEWMLPVDGSNIKVYDQKKSVKDLRNPPPGGHRGERAEGYADYIPGMIYVSPYDLRKKSVSNHSLF